MTFWYSFLCEAKHCAVNDPYPVEALMSMFLSCSFGLEYVCYQVFFMFPHYRQLFYPDIYLSSSWAGRPPHSTVTSSYQRQKIQNMFIDFAICEHYLGTVGKNEPRDHNGESVLCYQSVCSVPGTLHTRWYLRSSAFSLLPKTDPEVLPLILTCLFRFLFLHCLHLGS